MIRGFLSGAFWGTAIAALALGTVSELLPLPVARIEAEASRVPRPKPALVNPAAEADAVQPVPDAVQPEPTGPATEAIDPPAGSEFAKPLPDLAPVLPKGEEAPATAPTSVAPLTPPATDPVTPTDQPAAAPKTGLEAPKPLQPINESAEADGLPAPDLATKTALLVPGQPKLPQADVAPTPAENPVPPAKADPAEVLLKPLPDILPEPEPEPAPEPEIPGKPSAQLQPDAVLVPDPSPAAIDAPKASATLEPTPSLSGKVDGVTIGRLPRIGDAEAVPDGGAAPDAQPILEGDPAALVDDGTTDLPPLQKYARAFDNPDGKPLFCIILIDTGEADLDRASLAAMPFPVSFVLDPLAANVAQISKIYRDAGQEVIMVATGIPDGATASDLEVTFQSNAEALPEAVAVIDTEFGAFQANRPLATQVVPILKAQGRGLISWDRGLNAADQVARRDGLASGMVFRKLDGKGENTAAVRRALDRAAFKAAQDGRVMVIGQTLPETVAALMEWAVEGRAASVALAPVSATLTTE